MNVSFLTQFFLATVVTGAGFLSARGQGIASFEQVTVRPAFELNGVGTNIDSIAFLETSDPGETLMFVTGKGNDRVEVWKYPFEDSQLDPIRFNENVNGVVVDQETGLLYVSDRVVTAHSAPDFDVRFEFGDGTIGVGENNLDILKHTNCETWIYVSDDHTVFRYNASTLKLLGSFEPPVTSIETVLADDFHQVIFVPEEQGIHGGFQRAGCRVQ